jgi:hypothetical protein
VGLQGGLALEPQLVDRRADPERRIVSHLPLGLLLGEILQDDGGSRLGGGRGGGRREESRERENRPRYLPEAFSVYLTFIS